MQSKASIKTTTDSYAGFYSCGLSMLQNGTISSFSEQEVSKTERLYSRADGLQLKVTQTAAKPSTAAPRSGSTDCAFNSSSEPAQIIQTTFTNNSQKPVTLELLTSFVFENIKADKIHRFTSFWSAEGRHKTDTINDLNLEKSWTGNAFRIEKFGNAGSMPVRRYFPFVALEDSENGTFTAIQLYASSSWQIEIICQHEDAVTVAGGIADSDFGAWTKVFNPGESLDAPRAIIATGKTLEEACNKILKAQTPEISTVDDHMGITFNEYCTTWGNPTAENLKKIADKLYEKAQGKIQYLVIDAGWYGGNEGYWWDYTGEWTVNPARFPNGMKGLKETADYIRSKGMIPGIWFELEVVSPRCSLWNDTDHLVKKNGTALTVGDRRFLDMENPWVINHLTKTVIHTLKECGFGYVKIDYNDTMGLGCDGNVAGDGFGENLRRKVQATQSFFRKMKQEIPGLVIENCSSGGHRLEPGFMETASMASFSDAHEIQSLPLIAANLHHLVKPEQAQIWSVMRKDDTDQRIFYSMCATLLGRMGLSGDIYDLSDHQWKLVLEGMDFYKKADSIIKNGNTTVIKTDVESYNKPEGNQLVLRVDEGSGKSLLIFHRFRNSVSLEEFMTKNELQFLAPELKNPVCTYGLADSDFSAIAILF